MNNGAALCVISLVNSSLLFASEYKTGGWIFFSTGIFFLLAAFAGEIYVKSISKKDD